MPDGRIGQDPWQMPVALTLVLIGLAAIYVCLKLVKGLYKGGPETPILNLIRFAAAFPIIGGVAMVRAGVVNVPSGGVALALLGLFAIGVGIGLATTKEQAVHENERPS